MTSMVLDGNHYELDRYNVSAGRRGRAGQELDDARVRGGQAEFAALGLADDIYVTIPRGSYAQLAASMDVMADLVAPLSSGTKVGEVKVSLAGSELAKSAVIVLTNVTDGGVWARMRDELTTLWE